MQMDKEYIVDPLIHIMSRTDKLGNIVYANDNFAEISGYSKEELTHSPHNLVSILICQK